MHASTAVSQFFHAHVLVKSPTVGRHLHYQCWAPGLYFFSSVRPLKLKTDVIKKKYKANELRIKISHTNKVYHCNCWVLERIWKVVYWHNAEPVLINLHDYGDYRLNLKRGQSVLLSPEHFEDIASLVYSCAFVFESVAVSCLWLSHNFSYHFIVSDILIYRSLFWPCGCCIWFNNDRVIRSNVNNSGLLVLAHLSAISSAFYIVDGVFLDVKVHLQIMEFSIIANVTIFDI